MSRDSVKLAILAPNCSLATFGLTRVLPPLSLPNKPFHGRFPPPVAAHLQFNCRIKQSRMEPCQLGRQAGRLARQINVHSLHQSITRVLIPAAAPLLSDHTILIHRKPCLLLLPSDVLSFSGDQKMAPKLQFPIADGRGLFCSSLSDRMKRNSLFRIS